MSNESNANLNAILGQLEDELLQIKSAKDQVDDMISSNTELSASLERLIGSSKGLVQQSSAQTKEAAETLSKEADRLSENREAIARASVEGVEAIDKQASSAQATLEEAANTAVEKISFETTRLADSSKAMERASTETSETIQRQAAGAQATLEQAANSAVDKISFEISGLTERAIKNLNTGLDKAKGEIDFAAESLNTAASDAKRDREALLKAHEAASNESKQQSAETKALLEEARRYLVEIDAKIATLKNIDIDSLIKEFEELKSVEANNTTALKKQLTTVTIMTGACIAICLATLAKLFIA